MTNTRQALGRWGEEIAASYLIRHDYVILDRNAHTQYGEIDLVARKNDVTVFVEVKTRTSTRYGFPEEAVTQRKQAHLVAAAQAYLVDHPELDGDWRLDVIAVQKLRSGQAPIIAHFENAIR